MEEQKNLKWAERLVSITDTAFKIPGTQIRFGLDPIIGLVPVAGETVTLIVSLAMVVGFAREGASTQVLLKMLGNVGIDYLIGSIPLLGDIFDFGFRANQRNLLLAQKYLPFQKTKAEGVKGLVAIILIVFLLLVAAVGFLSYKIIEWLFMAI